MHYSYPKIDFLCLNIANGLYVDQKYCTISPWTNVWLCWNPGLNFDRKIYTSMTILQRLDLILILYCLLKFNSIQFSSFIFFLEKYLDETIICAQLWLINWNHLQFHLKGLPKIACIFFWELPLTTLCNVRTLKRSIKATERCLTKGKMVLVQ